MERPMVIRLEENESVKDTPDEDYGRFVSVVVTYFSKPDHKGRKRKKERKVENFKPDEVDLLYV